MKQREATRILTECPNDHYTLIIHQLLEVSLIADIEDEPLAWPWPLEKAKANNRMLG